MDEPAFTPGETPAEDAERLETERLAEAVSRSFTRGQGRPRLPRAGER